MATLQSFWGINFQIETDDRYAWFNFEKYYPGAVPLVVDDKTVDLYLKKSGVSKEYIAVVGGKKRKTKAIN